MKDIGTKLMFKNKEVTVTKRVMCDWGSPSTFYEAKTAEGDTIIVHSNYVDAAMKGVPMVDPHVPRVRGPRKVSTKKERALKWVRELKKQRTSRGEIIKVLAKKLRVTRNTASTYYYAVK